MRYVVDRNVVMRHIPVFVLELTVGEFAAIHPDQLTFGVRSPGCTAPREFLMICRRESPLTILRTRISIASDLSLKRVNSLRMHSAAGR